MVHEAKVSAGNAELARIHVEQDAFPRIGRRTVAEIEAPSCLQSCAGSLPGVPSKPPIG